MNDQTAVRFVKLDEANNELPADATEWFAVQDNNTGLIWMAEALDKRMSWNEAQATVASVGNGWRLPTIQELLSIVDYSRFNPAIDTTFFRGVPTKDCWWFWSSTPVASSPSDYAWLVYFGYGGSYYDYQGGEGLVRPVRSARARQ